MPSTSPLQPGGTSSVASGRAHSAGPCDAVPGARARRGATSGSTRLAGEDDRRSCSARGPAAPPAPERSAGAAPQTETRMLTSSTSAVLVAVAVALLVRVARTPPAAARGRGPPGAGARRATSSSSTAQLERLAAVAQLVAHAQRAPGAAESARRRLCEQRLALAAQALGA